MLGDQSHVSGRLRTLALSLCPSTDRGDERAGGARRPAGEAGRGARATCDDTHESTAPRPAPPPGPPPARSTRERAEARTVATYNATREGDTSCAPSRSRPLSSLVALSRLSAYVSLGLSAAGHGGIVIHSTVTITELKSILLLTELKSSQSQVYTADCAAFTEVALRP